jgi:hypothetical protein
MEWLNSILALFQGATWDQIVITIMAVIMAAEKIADWTPTTKDNDIIAAIKTFFSALALKKTS